MTPVLPLLLQLGVQQQPKPSWLSVKWLLADVHTPLYQAVMALIMQISTLLVKLQCSATTLSTRKDTFTLLNWKADDLQHLPPQFRAEDALSASSFPEKGKAGGETLPGAWLVWRSSKEKHCLMLT